MSNLLSLEINLGLRICMLVIIMVPFMNVGMQAQDTIRLENPSFEDIPRCCKAPQGWESLDFPGNTPPDVQPGGGFTVDNLPYDGKTYLAMVTRDDGTFETVFQQLSTPLLSDKCYVFSVFLAISRQYISGTRSSPDETTSFTYPTILQILGGNHPDDPELEILNASSAVDHHGWIEYVFEFIPSEDFSYIFLSAHFPEGIEYFTNGHILLDQLSDIVPCNDDMED